CAFCLCVFCSSHDHPDLHSFPTRRSSDLFALLENARAVESASSHEQHAPADVGHDAHHASHASGDHDAAGKDQRAAHEGWDRCPVGAAFAFAFIAADAPLAEPAQAEPVALDESVTLVVRELAEGYLARAPPRV